jgi:hypothetical protein
MEGRDMGEWISIEQWQECLKLARPGIIFEISNAEGKSMFTPCVVPLPPVPFNWKSAPARFRAIPEPAPQHSSPLPEPSKGTGR